MEVIEVDELSHLRESVTGEEIEDKLVEISKAFDV
jgi:hypothetical protein